ncbi:hypothetical protein AB1Y20_000687 [Prymnesium parvum]|uniref:RRM domain-containing protein n=1 Tax=Prymnesium parvum TaxID=97485 RepID=A0AB34K9T2_PRYPA
MEEEAPAREVEEKETRAADEDRDTAGKKEKKRKHKHHKEHKEHRESKHRRRKSEGTDGEAGGVSDGDAAASDTPKGDAAAADRDSREDDRDRDRDRPKESRSRDSRDDRNGHRDDRGRRSPPRRSPPYRRSPPPYGRRSPPPYRRSPPPNRYADDRRFDDRRRDDRRYSDRRVYDDRRRYDDRGDRGRGRGGYRRISPSVSRSPPRKKKTTPAPAVDDGKPKRFWDGFQWVDADIKTVASQSGPLGQATRKDRRLYVGNLPIGSGLTEKQLSEFIGSSMKQRAMIPPDAADPVLSVWMSPEGTYAFVEFHSVDYANLALGLNGIMLLTTTLRVSRPNNYQPSVGAATTGLEGLGEIALLTSGASSISSAAPLGGTGPTAGNLNPQAILGALGACTGAIPAASAPAPLSSTVLRCSNMLTREELEDTEEREALKEDVTEECNKYGTVEAIKIPVKGNELCNLYVKWSTLSGAEAALKALAGRKFDGRVVGVSSVPEAQFDALIDGV